MVVVVSLKRALVLLSAGVVLLHMFAGCMAFGPRPTPHDWHEARLAELDESYIRGSGRLLTLADFPADADWVALDLVVTEPVDLLRIEVGGMAESPLPLEIAEPKRCALVFYEGQGGFLAYSGDSYTLDTHALKVPGPASPLAATQSAGDWGFAHPEPYVDHRVLVAVDDKAAWLERGDRFDITVSDGVEVHWRLADSGESGCLLDFADISEGGVAARVAGVGAASEVYHRWMTTDGGFLGLLWRADLQYHIYVVWQDRYALAEWESGSSAGPGGGYALLIGLGGPLGIYAPVLAGMTETHLVAFLAHGYPVA